MKPLIQVQAVSQRFNTASGEFLAISSKGRPLALSATRVAENRPC